MMQRIHLPDGLQVTALNRAETEFLWEEIFVHQVYLRHGLTLRNGDCVVDVGANIGLFSLWASARVQGLRLHALEPIPELFSVLRTNVSRLPGTEPHEIALGKHEGTARFRYYPRATGWSSCQPEDHKPLRESLRAWLKGRSDRPIASRLACFPLAFSTITRPLFTYRERECALTTLSGFMRKHAIETIDLLKIDVEGSETDVLAGISPDDWPRIRQITLETDQHQLDGIIRLLRSRCYHVFSETTEMLAGTPFRHVYARRD
jgi:FkbM family methyltransferase